MPTVFTMGEALIDFIPHQAGVGLREVEGFRKAAGGAPANVACAVSRLGGKSAFIGKLGADAFGDFLIETMQTAGVDTSRVLQTNEANTALAFVSLKADGNRDFSFYRNPSADMLLNENEIRPWFREQDILHFCSVDLIEAPVKYAHLKAIFLAKEAGALISFDPNVRLPLWDNAEHCRQTILEVLPLAHIVKVSDEELGFITGLQDEREAIDSLFAGDVQHVIYTRGAQGAIWYNRNFEVSEPGLQVNVIDTTGAGDAFIGALLYQISQMHERNIIINSAVASEMLAFANKAAAITTTRPGAIPALPTRSEVESA
ncbi:carbohydrate kinase [Paenibacillus sp. YPG26]|uniref:carbohydrate kinase family protein n=1 Tax=Paenibacillus sp. YPG26 TaxID=2878915 RepID=UPI00203B10EC|nr:carbohydrate kinase [Paenibacillus sp. YPG26]USB32194.1 carbohydrate kinase [Paenibacillus sp. YPG26]